MYINSKLLCPPNPTRKKQWKKIKNIILNTKHENTLFYFRTYLLLLQWLIGTFVIITVVFDSIKCQTANYYEYPITGK